MSFKVIKEIENIQPSDQNIVATIGTFDGLHKGHQTILQRLRDVASANSLTPMIITFDPHPRVVVTPHSPPLLLTTIEEKVKLMPGLLDGSMLILKFDEQMMQMTARDFVSNILIEKLRLKHLIVGYDHAFGKDRSGTTDELKKMGTEMSFGVEVIPPLLVNDMPISSSRIRRLFVNGDYDKAKKLLGHAYPVIGLVTKGIGLGRKIGYPTANLDVSPRKLLPKDGVYSCSVEVGLKKYRGMMFIGKNHFNPTVPKSVEVNIFDFSDDIYGEYIYIYPEYYIRENRKYDNTDLLVKQIELDKIEVMKVINRGV